MTEPLFAPAPFVAQSDTSRDRARQEDAQGITVARRRQTSALVNEAGVAGMTWKELSDATGLHHGQVSAVLSTLHKSGLLFQLKDRRHGCHPYVDTDFLSFFHADEVNLEPVKTRATRDADAIENLLDAVRAFKARGLGLGAILDAFDEVERVRG